MRMRSALKDFKSIVSCKISRRFALYTVGVSTLVAFLISSVFIYKNYHDGLENLKEELTQVEQSIKNSLALNLWQMNWGALDIILNDLLMDKDIVYLNLVDEKGNTLIKKGIEPTHYDIKNQLPLYFIPPGINKEIHLGQLNYIATTEPIYINIKRTILGVTIAIFIFFLFFTVAILFIFWNSTVKHLLTIMEYTNEIRLVGYNEKNVNLELDRHGNHAGHNKDELDELVHAINEMHHEVIEQYTRIEYQSLHDELTGLPNRRMINQLITSTITHCREINGYGALLSIDLDNFKLLNESIGHTVGDKILCEIARRLVDISKNELQPARISGDEFILLQQNVASSRAEAREIADRLSRQILSGVSQAISIDDHHFKISACIGIALFGPRSSPDIIVKQSDNALHHAKSEGPGHIAFFEPAMQQRTDRRLELEQLIDKAIDESLLLINYQPKYDLNRNLCSAEALVRMHDGDENLISPGEFIPVLEETGAILQVGDHIIGKVFRFIRDHKNDIENSRLESIAINVSPTQFASSNFANRIIDLSSRFEIDPESIILEITEEVVAGSIDSVVDVMHQLDEYGFKFSVDDFGTGYSSLRYLKNLPLRELKIDRSFVNDITTDSKAAAIVKTIIDMAHNFGLNVVAEGVETEEQLNRLVKYQCEQYQGFFFSRPLTEESFLDVMRENSLKA